MKFIMRFPGKLRDVIIYGSESKTENQVTTVNVRQGRISNSIGQYLMRFEI